MTKCPMCGYVEVEVKEQVSNVMNRYVQKEDGKNPITMNSEKDEITVGKIVYIKEDKFIPKPAGPITPPVTPKK